MVCSCDILYSVLLVSSMNLQSSQGSPWWVGRTGVPVEFLLMPWVGNKHTLSLFQFFMWSLGFWSFKNFLKSCISDCWNQSIPWVQLWEAVKSGLRGSAVLQPVGSVTSAILAFAEAENFSRSEFPKVILLDHDIHEALASGESFL